jgi:HEAT repeat protein
LNFQIAKTGVCKVPPQKLLDELIAMERHNVVDEAKVLNLLAELKSQLAELPAIDIFPLINSSHDLEEDEAYWACIHHLRNRPEEIVFEQCCAWAKDISSDRRQAAAQILAQLGYAQEYPYGQRSHPILLALLADSNVEVIVATLYAFGHLKIGDPKQLAIFVSHHDNEIRCAAASALEGREDSVSVEGVIKLSRDSDRDVRNWATFYLSWLDEVENPEIDNALFERTSESDAEIRGEALIGLAKRQNMRVLEPLKTELAGEFHGAWCIEAAHELKNFELKPLLVELKYRLSAQDTEAFGKELEEAIDSCV